MSTQKERTKSQRAANRHNRAVQRALRSAQTPAQRREIIEIGSRYIQM